MCKRVIKISNRLGALVLAVLFLGQAALASDHIDGRITIDDPVADLTDLFLFPSPEKPGHLVMILNSYPFVGGKGHFSDRLSYNFNIRRVATAGNGVNSAFELLESFDFRCTFFTPRDRHAPYTVNCKGPGKWQAGAQLDEITAATEDQAVRVFAGRRLDPFLFNSDWFLDIAINGVIPPFEERCNDASGFNVLSIVLEVDVDKVFGKGHSNLFAVAAEIMALDEAGNEVRRIDRVGRPEISNGRLVTSAGEQDLRNSYNSEANFDTAVANAEKYRQRMLSNINYYDALDGVRDWQPDWRRTLASILLNDFLVVDAGKPYSPEGYFEIEKAMLRSQPHARAGGRTPAEDVMNSIFTVVVNGGHGPDIKDGISLPDQPMQQHFPYLNKPNRTIFAWLKQKLGSSSAAKQAFEIRQ